MVLQYIEALDALARRNEISATLKQRIESLRSADTTLAAIAEGLAASDDVTFGLADNAAKARGMETFAQHANRFREGKGWLGYHLFRLLQDANDVRLEEVLEMATERIDLAQVARGPARELGLGPGTESYHLLTSVLQELARFPGRGARFLLAGLGSPVIPNRNMALRTLAAWGRERWSPEIREALESAARIEPDEDVQARFERVLAGAPYDEEVRTPSPD